MSNRLVLKQSEIIFSNGDISILKRGSGLVLSVFFYVTGCCLFLLGLMVIVFIVIDLITNLVNVLLLPVLFFFLLCLAFSFIAILGFQGIVFSTNTIYSQNSFSIKNGFLRFSSNKKNLLYMVKYKARGDYGYRLGLVFTEGLLKNEGIMKFIYQFIGYTFPVVQGVMFSKKQKRDEELNKVLDFFKKKGYTVKVCDEKC